MECPYCGAKLVCEDSYGTKEYIIYGNENYKNGDIYRCPNHEGFSEIEDAMNYICQYYNVGNKRQTQEEMNKMINDYFKEFEIEDLTEVACESSCHSVSGSFYTDRQDNLHEGYPC